MHFRHVCLEALGYSLPAEAISSDEIESRLGPLYERLRLPPGRLELMTGIRQRRFWPEGTLPGDHSIRSGRLALQAAQIAPDRIGALIHASVCRDHLEPATACRVHHALGLPEDCVIYDLSNACLGVLNGILQAASMIELGQVEAALVVSSEGSRALVETTIDHLNRDLSWNRQSVKLAVASLTIGSASVGVVVCHEKISRSGNRVLGGHALARTAHHRLCHSGADEAAGDGMRPLMTTDSERLMAEGIATGAACYPKMLAAVNWQPAQVDRTCCHQVGTAHRRAMLEALGRDTSSDFATLEYLGNTGSAALPVSLAIGAESGFYRSGDRIGLLGIGSGINCVMLGVEWNQTLVQGEDPLAHLMPWRAAPSLPTAGT